MSTSFNCIPEINPSSARSPADACLLAGISGLGTAKKRLEPALGNLEKRGAGPEVEQEAQS
jgi:hypothetical protein